MQPMASVCDLACIELENLNTSCVSWYKAPFQTDRGIGDAVPHNCFHSGKGVGQWTKVQNLELQIYLLHLTKEMAN